MVLQGLDPQRFVVIFDLVAHVQPAFLSTEKISVSGSSVYWSVVPNSRVPMSLAIVVTGSVGFAGRACVPAPAVPPRLA